uniref:hypothetical protein n=1 Tax=Cephaloticoccus sp. TaxID=1985742 RepID=UPI00404B4B99
GAAQGFKIVAATVAGAGINHQAGMAALQFIPEGQITADMFDFGYTLSICRIFGSPGIKRVFVRILPIHIDALGGDKPVKMVDDPVQGFGVAEIHHVPIGKLSVGGLPVKRSDLLCEIGSHRFGQRLVT